MSFDQHFDGLNRGRESNQYCMGKMNDTSSHFYHRIWLLSVHPRWPLVTGHTDVSNSLDVPLGVPLLHIFGFTNKLKSSWKRLRRFRMQYLEEICEINCFSHFFRTCNFQSCDQKKDPASIPKVEKREDEEESQNHC